MKWVVKWKKKYTAEIVPKSNRKITERSRTHNHNLDKQESG
jgi:hypothetical protein